ncbi:hypothetical protein RJ55_05040 [Drechmeria coniospora]|nr:hypothetical protein RJ55_05040 [Drechmeria coniospora]
MILKRKRSVSELGLSPSPAYGSPPPPNVELFTMDVSPRTAVFDIPPAHLPSRTFKRFRDGRPSDDEVHGMFAEAWIRRGENAHSQPSLPAEHTLQLLFSAQHQQQRPPAQQLQQHLPLPIRPGSPPPALASVPVQETMPQGAPLAGNFRQQQSLHRFWDIGSTPTSTPSTPGAGRPTVTTPATTPTGCEDCGASLRDGSNGDAMDVDDVDAQSTLCGACGKHVCFSCSVSNLGEGKRCLHCAGRTLGMDRPGWPKADVPVC